ncbi:YjbH domain-containing protein [Escherichia coli]
MASKQAGHLTSPSGSAWGYTSNAGNITNPFCQVSDKYCHGAEFFSDAGSEL